MKKNKFKIFITAIIVILIVVLGILIFKNDQYKLSSTEKSWITNNANSILNVNVINDTNIFGKLGKGVFYDFLQDFKDEYNLKINNVMVSKNEQENNISFVVTDTKNDNALNFYEDHYIVVSKKSEFINLDSLTNQKIGILNFTEKTVKNYFNNQAVSFTNFSNFSDLRNALNNGTISYIIVPRMEYVDEVLKNNFNISYHLSDLKRYFYATDSTSSTLFQIMTKYFHSWSKKSLEDEIFAGERSVFQDALSITDASIDEIKKQTIRYGFVNNAPYEVYGDGNFGGILACYIKDFAKFSGADIEYVKYASLKKMNKDINNINLYFNYNTSLTNGSIVETNLPLFYDVYASSLNDTLIHSFNSLKDITLYVENNSLLQQNLSKIQGLKLETYEKDKLDKVLKDENNIIIIDSLVGKYLEKSTLKNYTSRYHSYLNVNYSMKSTQSEDFNLLMTKYISYVDNNLMVEKGMHSASVTESKGAFVNSLAKYLLYSVLVILVILFIIYRSSKKVRMQKKIKKEDKLKFVDQLTSLKNRNYLNENMPNWNKNTLYPQCVIMIDLKKIQEINDTLGYEEGDNQIKSAANSLIKTQLDNTDIIRTNGNEFMIYSIGYNQKQITSYIHKLSKELNNLPYNYGVCITYSMIENDLKSIEDAINECVEDIKNQKGKDTK